MRILTFLLILNCWVVSFVHGQNAKEDLQRLESVFNGVEDVYLEMENRVYSKGKITNSEQGIIRKQGGNYLYELDKMTMLVDKENELIVMVNHGNYTIAFDHWSKAKADQLAASYVPSSDDLIERYPLISFKGDQNGQKHYVFESSKQKMSKIEVFLEQATGIAKRMVYHYNPAFVKGGVKMELLIRKINLKPNFASTIFSASRFFTLQNKKAQVTSKYQNYSLHDMRRK